jgi:hypothetical protein
LVGDDIIILYAVIQPGMTMETYYVSAAESGGWKVSKDDTFDSTHLMYYCEEASLVPQRQTDASRHRLWRGKAVRYIDVPRLRLLLPVKMETDIYSNTNIGRFSLMGKETRDTIGTSSEHTTSLMLRAQLLQHLVVPRDKETLCPYLPKEIGGDGAYTPDHTFLERVISAKAIDPAEALYRMREQMRHFWSHRFVHTEQSLVGVHKQHLLTPTLERLREWIPKRSIIVPPSVEHNELLRSLPRGLLEPPETTFFKVVKHVYYKYVFLGKLLPSLRVKADLTSKRGSTPYWQLASYFSEEGEEGVVNRYDSYLRQWRRPGFNYDSRDPYYVLPHRHHDVMSLGWTWRIRPEPAKDISSLSVHDFLDVILYNRNLPLVVDRLNMFFESDPLLEIRVRENDVYRGDIIFISRDMKRGASLLRWVRSNRDRKSRLIMVSPEIYFLGRLSEITNGLRAWSYLEDAGSLNWYSRNMGSSNLYDVVCNEIEMEEHRFHSGCWTASVEGFNIVGPTMSSVRTHEVTSEDVSDLVITNQNAVHEFMSVLFNEGQEAAWNTQLAGPLIRNQVWATTAAPLSGTNSVLGDPPPVWDGDQPPGYGDWDSG